MLAPEVLRIGRDGHQGLGGHVEQQRIDRSLVAVSDGADRCRQAALAWVNSRKPRWRSGIAGASLTRTWRQHTNPECRQLHHVW